MQRTKHTVLNQQMLQPPSRDSRKTCHMQIKTVKASQLAQRSKKFFVKLKCFCLNLKKKKSDFKI